MRSIPRRWVTGGAHASPGLVTLHLWGVPTRSVVPSVASLVAARRLALSRGATFARVLGTSVGGRMTLAGADLRHWAMLACWPSPAQEAAVLGRCRSLHRVHGRATEHLVVRMRPLASRGRWAGTQPFGAPRPQEPGVRDGPVAVLTRARVRTRHLAAFSRTATAVAADLAGRPGLRLALGVGEAPVGLQGTFSVWQSADALSAFAYGGAAHRAAVRRTTTEGWYAEELFARLAVVDVSGSYLGSRP